MGGVIEGRTQSYTQYHQSTQPRQDPESHTTQETTHQRETGWPPCKSEEEQVYDFLWGGSIHATPSADASTLDRMNKIYDAHKKAGRSLAEIYEFHETLFSDDPLRISIPPGMLRTWQCEAMRTNERQRLHESAEIMRTWPYIQALNALDPKGSN
jgi:hypothetical protein